MKVAMVVPGGVDASGEVRVIPALLALLGRLAAEHDLHVFATHQEPLPGNWLLAGAKVHNLGLPRTAARALRAVLAEHRTAPFEIVHSIWAGACGAIAVTAAALLRVPSIVHVAGGELVAIDDIGYGGCRTWRGRYLASGVLRRATAVTCASAPIAALIETYGVRPQRVPLGVDLERWPPRCPRPRSPGDRPRFVHVASLNAVKDQATLLRALRMLADRGWDFQVDVVGEDTLDGRIQALSAELGIASRLTFHGFLPHAALRPIVESAHLSLVSSRHEAGPLVLLEAAVAGVPTAGTAVGHLAEWSPNAALAVPCADPTALVVAIESLLDDDSLRLRLASEAQRRAVREDADTTARGFDAVYRRLRRCT